MDRDSATQVRLGSVRSADGTTIGYRSHGEGPAVIVVPGALGVAADFDSFARALTGFAVHVVDRRGRGSSGPQGDRYTIDKECADICAVRDQTGADLLVGHSFGGLVVLETATRATDFRALVVYEPGVSVAGSIRLDWVEQCTSELERGDGFGAFLTFIRGINPDATGKVPRWLLRLILPRAMGKQELAQKISLLPTTIAEHREAARLNDGYDQYRQISADVLLLTGRGGSKAVAGQALSALRGVLPGAAVHRFPALDHFGLETKPDVVAPVVAAFLQPGPG